MAEIVHIPLGGGGGGSSTDRFEAAIIVGNTLAGDPAVAQAAPFRYIPDPGDGSGVLLAIAEATAGFGSTRIRVRPGTYTFTAGSVPVAIPASTTLEGSGIGATVFQPASDEDRFFFSLGAGARIADLTIQLTTAGAAPTGAQVLRFTDGSVAERISITVGSGVAGQEGDSLVALYALFGSSPKVLDSSGSYIDFMTDDTATPSVAIYQVGPRQSGSATIDAIVRGETFGYAEQLFVGTDVNQCKLEVKGNCASVATVSGDNHDLRLQSIVNLDGLSPENIPVTLSLSCNRSTVTLEIDGLINRLMDVSGDLNDIRVRAVANGDANGDAVNVSGAENTFRGNIRGPLGDTPSVIFTIDGNGNSVNALSFFNGDAVINGNRNMIVASRFDLVTDNGSLNEVAHVTTVG